MKFGQPAWTRHIPPPEVLRLATLGPLGLRMRAPGTWGSAAGLLFFIVCFVGFHPLGILGSLITCALAAWSDRPSETASSTFHATEIVGMRMVELLLMSE